jgi:hypothetical protein
VPLGRTLGPSLYTTRFKVRQKLPLSPLIDENPCDQCGDNQDCDRISAYDEGCMGTEIHECV